MGHPTELIMFPSPGRRLKVRRASFIPSSVTQCFLILGNFICPAIFTVVGIPASIVSRIIVSRGCVSCSRTMCLFTSRIWLVGPDFAGGEPQWPTVRATAILSFSVQSMSRVLALFLLSCKLGFFPVLFFKTVSDFMV